MLEIWKAIPSYEDSYQVSNMGNVRSLDRAVIRTYKNGRPTSFIHCKGKPLKVGLKQCGHLTVSLGAKNYKLVHRLVLRAFVGEPPNGMEALHINGIPSDNRLENLRWGTRKENREDISTHAQLYRRQQGSSNLTMETIRNIKRDLAKPDCPSQKVLAVKYAVHYNTINNINRGFVHKWVDI